MKDRHNRSWVGANSHIFIVPLSTIIKHCQRNVTNHTHYWIILRALHLLAIQ